MQVLCHGLSPDVEHCAKARWKAFASKRQPSSGSHKIPREAGWRVRDILSAARGKLLPGVTAAGGHAATAMHDALAYDSFT